MNAAKVCSVLLSASALLVGCSTTPTPGTDTGTTAQPAQTTTTPTQTTTQATTTGSNTGRSSSSTVVGAGSLSLDPATRARLVQQLSQLDANGRAQLLQQTFGSADATTRARFLEEQGMTHLDPSSRLAKERSVFFDFDKFNIRDDYTALVQLHGGYLAKNGNLSVKVEGNADERGSREYNLALGQKRAESVVRAFKAVGVKDGQVEAVSFGEDKPLAAGHAEAAWSQNRRADVNYGLK